MLSDWNFLSLRDCIVHKKGYAFKSKDYRENGVPVVKVTNLTDNSIDMNSVVFVDKDIAKANESVSLQKNDIIIATVGSWATNPASVVGKTVKVPSIANNALLNQNAVRLRPANKNIDNIFLYYLLKNKSFGNYLVSNAQGSANQASITLNDIYSYRANIPPLPIQKKIAHILSTLDDKIDLNRKMNQTLEEMAQALFKSWFVDFGPVHSRADAKSDEALDGAAAELGVAKEVLELFPSEFVENEMGMIPKGWEVKELGELTNITSSKRIYSREYTEDGIPFYRSKEIINLANGNAISDILYISKDRFSEIKDKFLVPKIQDILITSVGTIGRIYLVPDDSPFYFKDGNLTWINDYKDTSPIFVYNFLKSANTQRQIDSVLIGSTQKALTIVNINKLAIVIPSLVILEEFTKQAQSIFNQITINVEQTSVLEKTRDTLLPQLLSGELDVLEMSI